MGTQVEAATGPELETMGGPGVGENGRLDEPEVDVEAILSRSRPLGFRRKSLYSAPEFVKRLDPVVEANSGEQVLFECTYKGFPKPKVRWLKDDEELEDGDRFQQEEDGASLVLRIPKAQNWDEGTYRCRLENQEGATSTTCFLEVKGEKLPKPLSAQTRKNPKRSVSLPPHLRAIREQKSMEEREAEAQASMSPSPIHRYVEEMRAFHRSRSSSDPDKDENENERASVGETDVSPLPSSVEDQGGLIDSTPNSDSVFFDEDHNSDLNSSVEETPYKPPKMDAPAAIQLPLARNKEPPHIPSLAVSDKWLYYCPLVGVAVCTAIATKMDIGWFIIFLAVAAVFSFAVQDIVRSFRGR